MEIVDSVDVSSWSSLSQDILERIGCELPLHGIFSARLVCHQWSQHVGAAVQHLPHAHQHRQRQLVELDAQPAGREGVWQKSLTALAACLPHLSELMVYVSSRVSSEHLGAQLHSLPAALTSLTKLELRYIVPSSIPCLGTTLQQLQPSLTGLTGLGTLYLIMGTSPEPAEVAAVLPALSALRDLKLLSGLPQYGFTNSKLEALGCATQLRRLHLEVSGVGQVDAGLAALSQLRHLQQLWLDGLVTLGPAVMCALQQLPELQELRLELDDPQHIPDLFALSALKRLSLTYHGDELDEADEPLDGVVIPNNGHVGGVVGGSSADWDALERMVRGHADQPVLCELGLLCCSFPGDPLPRLALLTSLTSLTFYDCRWKAMQRPAAVVLPAVPREVGTGSVVAAQPSVAPTAPHSWGVLTSLVGLQGFGMAQCMVPGISEFDLESLAAAWPGVTSLQLQSTSYRISQLPLLPLRPPPARFGAFLSRWRRLEALTLSGSWCNDPRIALDVSLLPPSLTSLIVSSVTLINSVAAKATILEGLNRDTKVISLAEQDVLTGRQSCSRLFGLGVCAEATEVSTLRSSVVGAVTCQGDRQGQLVEPDGASSCYNEMSSNDDAKTCSTGVNQGQICRCANGQPCSICLGSSGSNCNSSGCTYLSQAQPAAAPLTSSVMLEPVLPALEHLVLGEVRLGCGVSLPQLVRSAPNLRSLEINNLLPNLTDESCTALAALTALTVLRVSQDQDPEGGEARSVPSGALALPQPAAAPSSTAEDSLGARKVALSGMGLTALTGLKNLRQLEWLPWGCEPLDMVHVEALARLRRLHLITLRGARDGAIAEHALEALRERLPLCDIDDTEWSGLVDV